MGRGKKIAKRGIFVTGTDTGVGKTVAMFVLGTLLQEKGWDVGVMKPVQCGGDDARFLQKFLRVTDSLDEINPYFVPEPLSPHLAFKRAKRNINPQKILAAYQELKAKHDLLLVEGAGGLLVPLAKDYLVSDLIQDLDLDVVIVSRLGLGTINHTLLTIGQARELGLNVKGVIFSESKKTKKGTAEKTNPKVIEEYGNVPVLGTIPYLNHLNRKSVLEKCRSIQVNPLLKEKPNVTKRLVDWDRQYIWHPFTQMKDWVKEQPLIIDQGKGCYLTDTDGNRYLDGVSSLWVNVHGHRNKSLDRALKSQINQLSHSTLLGLSNTPAIELAKELVDITPDGLEKVFYSDNGSTSVEIAIKIAYQYWQNKGKTSKNRIAHLKNSYHGDTLGSVSVGGIDLFHKVYQNLIFETVEIDFPDCYRAPQGKEYPCYAYEFVGKFEQLLKNLHRTIAAFVVEPIVQGAAGMIMWPKGILKRMHKLCKQYDVIFIADEVATGFGRTGEMFACEHEGVAPDIMCLAKGITGGYLPLGVTITTNNIYNGFLFDYKEQKTFFHGHTYTGNPLCCAAALANIKIFKKERILGKLVPKIKYLDKRLQMFYNLPHVGDVRQKGFMVGIELVKDRQAKAPYPWEQKIGLKVCQRAREKGIIIRPLGNVIVLMPPLIMSKRELDQLLEATYWAIEKITEK